VTGRLLLGTSGFAYKEWKGDFYPAQIKADAMLAYYSSKFPSVEINYTFQRNPTETMIAKWLRDTPPEFRFSFKANRAITHNRRLSREAAAPLAALLAAIEPLGERAGAILFQCPPNFKLDLERIKDFLTMLPPGGRYAFEFRHESCRDDSVIDALADRDVAWCVAETDDYDAPLIRTARDFTYIRLRKAAYEDEQLARWAKEIESALGDGIDVYCYLKHEDEGRGAHFAQALAEMVRLVPNAAPGSPASELSPPETSEDRERT
jgi:uncharacterized protein YecE (DUF72 family)